LIPVVGNVSFLLFTPAVLIVAVTFGRTAGILLTAIGTLNLALVASQFIPWEVFPWEEIWAFVVYLTLSLGCAMLGGRMRLVSLRATSIEQRLALAEEDTGIGVFELDFSDRTAYVSKGLCTLLGQTFVDSRIPLDQWLANLGSDHVEESRRSIQRHLEAGELSYEREQCVPLPDGGTRWLLSRVRLEVDAAGTLLRARGATVDISDQKLLRQKLAQAQETLTEEREREQQRLLEADRRKDEFVATLAHELRGPLAPIWQAVAVMRSTRVDETRRQNSLDIVERQIKRMTRLLDDLLDISRISRGRFNLSKTKGSTTAIVDMATETAMPHLQSKNQTLSVSLPHMSQTVELDSFRISQVLANLLINASKYSAPQTTISLSVQHGGRDLTLIVEDSGIGISETQTESIFEMFAQAPEGVRQSQGGLGIGLALSKNIVELHGGSITAQSRGLSKGSKFVVSLPNTVCSETPEHGIDSLDDANRADSKTVRTKILVADDNVDSATSLAEVLRLAGHDVYVACDGISALSTFDDISPAVAFLDVGMPGMSGLEVARSIRRRPEGPHVTLVAVSGWGQERDRNLALASGFDHHATKPVDPKLLFALIPNQEEFSIDKEARPDQT
jgi:signal transduction histidine kinase/ActR/RegA family two-component response regulator